MNFKEDIDKAYADLKLIPINGQEKIIDQILTEFFINGKKSVIGSFDTGIGKSIIGAVVSKVFTYRFEDEYKQGDILPSIIAVHSNSLVKQYSNTFKDFPSKQFHQILGANNYKCEAGSHLSVDKHKAYTGEDCFKKMADKNIVERYCNSCEYNIAKSMINNTDALITNYSYHFISSLWSRHLKPRKLTVFDEAHTINDVFCDHTSIFVSVERIESYIDECRRYFPMATREQIEILESIKNEIKNKQINESNYVRPLNDIMTAYKAISVVFEKEAKEADLDNYVKYNKIAKKYFNLGCKIGDLFTHKYDHVFEDKNLEFSVKPIFVGGMSKLVMSEYNLFMSATISAEFMNTTLDLKPHDTAFIKCDPVYDPANKPINFIGNHRLNYSAMNNPEIIRELQETVAAIVDAGAEDEYKGLLLVPSFAVGEQMVKLINNKKSKIFLHKPGEKIDKIVNEFKSYNKPAVLVSPSIYEGLDFADDHSRYQIILKSPFASLGDKRVKYIADNYSEIYRIMTIKKIVQGVGRSVRNKNDFCVTFILDKNAEILFKSSLNVWKNQFSY